MNLAFESETVKTRSELLHSRSVRVCTGYSILSSFVIRRDTILLKESSYGIGLDFKPERKIIYLQTNKHSFDLAIIQE